MKDGKCATSFGSIGIQLLALACLLAAPAMSFTNVELLQRSFEQPPDDSKIMMRWWWFGPAVTKPQLEREMKLMKEGGIGGFEVQPTYPLALDGDKPGLRNLRFLSPEFLDALTFTAQKAKELGLRMDLTLGSGWPYGGPMFPVSEAAGRLRTEKISIAVGQSSVPAPRMREGEKLIAAFLGPIETSQVAGNPYSELEIRDGAAQIPADVNSPAQVVFFIAGHTGMQVKRAAFGAEGYVIDHYNPAVIDKFIRLVADPEIKACGSNPPYAVFCDSLEVGGEDWTDNFLVEFRKRRGYDLRPLLPALVADLGPRTMDIRHDWGKTLTEIYNDYFNKRFHKWAKQHNTRFRIQGYGTPPAALYSYAYADLAEGEGYTWKGFRESRWAASASHLLGRRVTSSETWTWLHSPVFRATPLDMKTEADLHFLQGINQLIGHGWPYTADGIEYPGWRFYAAAVFNEKNPWWLVMPDVSKYLQRVSFMMRQGRPANDVALYLSNSDAWAQFVPGRVSMNAAVSQCLGRDVIRLILDSGYNLDFFDDGLLDLHGQVKNGTLAFGDLRYKVIVLAGVQRIPPSTMRKLDRFARSGGILIATRTIPSLAPGFMAAADERKTVRDIAQRLFQDHGAPAVFLQQEDSLGQAIANKLRPDVKFQPPEPEIGFVHRKTDSADIYFLANTSNVRKTTQATFRIEGRQPEWWNPMTGRISPAQITHKSDDGTAVMVDLEPYESNIIVFTKHSLPARSAAPQVASLPPAIDLSNHWSVTFGDNTNVVAMEKLRSWTDDEATRFFSGVATYDKTVTVPEAMLRDDLRLQISLGQTRAPVADTGRATGRSTAGPRMHAAVEAPVREAAVVHVNGRRAGSVWCPPYVLDITGLLKSGENLIRIEVANLAVNFMSARPLPDYRDLYTRYGNRFQPQDMEQIRPIASGLLGPIRITATSGLDIRDDRTAHGARRSHDRWKLKNH